MSETRLSTPAVLASRETTNPYRDAAYVKHLAAEIGRILPEALARAGCERFILMEVCGTHTQAVYRFGLRQLLPESLSLLSGPGCPVCVTSDAFIERARQLASMPDVTLCTFGDLMRVPGANGSLEEARTRSGADIRVIYSPWDALNMAEVEPGQRFVFLGVGFETTAPLTAATIQAAKKRDIENFFVLSAHKTMPATMRALAASGEIALHGFICPGHVSTITGIEPYRFLAGEYDKPCVVTGFEPVDVLQGILMLTIQAAEGRAEVENQYDRLVRPEGNPRARAILEDVFEPRDPDEVARQWAQIPGSGLGIRGCRMRHPRIPNRLPGICPHCRATASGERGCVCGEVLRGAKTPENCALFGNVCTPDRPRGPCMVSHEGACNTHFHYAR